MIANAATHAAKDLVFMGISSSEQKIYAGSQPGTGQIDAIESGKVAGAALDAFHVEPPPPGFPLFTLDPVLATPHIGGSTPEFIYRAFRFAAQQVRRFAAGEPLENVVTEAGY